MAKEPREPKPIPPLAVWEITLADGTILKIEAHRLTLNTGSLGFKDAADDYFIAYAPGEWRTCRRCEPPKPNP